MAGLMAEVMEDHVRTHLIPPAGSAAEVRASEQFIEIVPKSLNEPPSPHRAIPITVTNLKKPRL